MPATYPLCLVGLTSGLITLLTAKITIYKSSLYAVFPSSLLHLNEIPGDSPPQNTGYNQNNT